jgi:tetratricopeptide (TPR) repeat protein
MKANSPCEVVKLSGETKPSLTEGLYNLARNAYFAGRAEEAETLDQRCLALLGPFQKDNDSVIDHPAARVQARTILVHCYTGLGMVWTNRNALDKAVAFHQKAIALSEELVRLYPQPFCRLELRQSYLNLGATYQVCQERKKAVEAYRKAIVVQEALVRDLPEIPNYRLHAAGTCANIALILDRNQADEAFAFLKKGRDLLEPQLKNHPEDPRFANDYGNLCNNQALVLYHRGEPRKALPWHDRAVEVLTAAHGRHPNDSTCESRCGIVLGARAVTWAALGEHRKALADFDQALSIVAAAEAGQYCLYHAHTLTVLGEHRRAVEEIVGMVRRSNLPGDERYKALCFLSLGLAAAEKDKRLSSAERAKAAGDYAAGAMEALTRLQRDGYFHDPVKWARFAIDDNLSAPRRRDEFKRWCQSLSR